MSETTTLAAAHEALAFVTQSHGTSVLDVLRIRFVGCQAPELVHLGRDEFFSVVKRLLDLTTITVCEVSNAVDEALLYLMEEGVYSGAVTPSLLEDVLQSFQDKRLTESLGRLVDVVLASDSDELLSVISPSLVIAEKAIPDPEYWDIPWGCVAEESSLSDCEERMLLHDMPEAEVGPSTSLGKSLVEEIQGQDAHQLPGLIERCGFALYHHHVRTVNHRVSTLATDRTLLQATSFCFASACEIASRLRLAAFTVESLLRSRMTFRDSVENPTGADIKLLRQHADFDREVLISFPISVLGVLESSMGHLPSTRRVIEAYGAFVVGFGVSERHEVATTTFMSQLRRPSSVIQISGKALFFSTSKQRRTVLKVLFSTSRLFCAVSLAQQFIENFKFLRSFFEVLAACDPSYGQEKMRHLLHHLTFRVADTPNTWVSGNELLQLLLVFLSDSSSNLPAAESLLRAMEQHYSSPSVSQQTSMIKSILLHLPLGQVVDALQVTQDSQLSVVTSCEKQSLGAVTLPQPKSIKVRLLPERYAKGAELSLSFQIDCVGPAFGVLTISTTDPEGKYASPFATFPLTGLHSFPYHCTMKCRRWAPLHVSASFVSVAGAATSVFVEGDFPVSAFITRLSFSRFILSVAPLSGAAHQFPVSGFLTTSLEGAESHLHGLPSALYTLTTGEQFSLTLSDVAADCVTLFIQTTTLSLLGEVSVFFSMTRNDYPRCV